MYDFKDIVIRLRLYYRELFFFFVHRTNFHQLSYAFVGKNN